jgi:hypothetical protein
VVFANVFTQARSTTDSTDSPAIRSLIPQKQTKNYAKAEVAVGMSAVGGRADFACQDLSGPFLAEAVEEVFQPLKTERLIRLVTTCGKNESESVPP